MDVVLSEKVKMLKNIFSNILVTHSKYYVKLIF